MATLPNEIREAVSRDTDEAFNELCSNGNSCFAVDWHEQDEDIVEYCESLLRTGRLSAEWVDNELYVNFGTKRIRVPLLRSGADRHITLLTLNKALAPEFEVRMLYASVGDDTGVFVPLSSADWSVLESDAPEVVPRRFHRLTQHPNTFTELVKAPIKPGTRPWWRFWTCR